MSHPATVSDFRLDIYEVTVGRFRSFVETGWSTQLSAPPAGAGTHDAIPDSGWDVEWNADLAADRSELVRSLHCDTERETWTDEPHDDSRPINCVSWYTAMAFCAWDGGYLPTAAEWNYAAAGGDEQRAYPWSVPPTSDAINCSNVSYRDEPDGLCFSYVTGAVGGHPAGNARWGQCDMAGNVAEWLLDRSSVLELTPTNYIDPCVDCAQVAKLPDYDNRLIRGGHFESTAVGIRVSHSKGWFPTLGTHEIGFRCARHEN